MKNQNNKRCRSSRSTSLSSDSEQDMQSSASPNSSNQFSEKQSWPRFLVVCPLNDDQPLNKLSPFAISKALEGLAGNPKGVKVLKSGNILVEFDKKSYSDKLLKSKIFANIPIKVSPHQSLNFTKGVVRSRDLQNTSEEEMMEELRSQNVTDVKRIKFMRNGKQIVTNTFILTFDIPIIPPVIKAGFLNIKVDPYIPNPLRCFNCQRFGHHKDKCTKNAVCAKCGREGHDSVSCENPVCCFNCKGEHFAFSKECEKWKQEKEIQSIRVLKKVSFQEARKLAETSKPAGPSGVSYASKVKTVKSTAVQTEITWPDGCATFKRIASQSDNASGKKDSSSQSNQKIHDQTQDKPQKQPSQTKAKTDKKNLEGDVPLATGQSGAIQVYNKYSGLEDEESMDELPSIDPPKKPPKKRKEKKITPVMPPT